MMKKRPKRTLRMKKPRGLRRSRRWAMMARSASALTAKLGGKVTSYAYDAAGRLSSITRPGAASKGSLGIPGPGFAYDHAGNLTGVPGALERTTTYTCHDGGIWTEMGRPDPNGSESLVPAAFLYTHDARVK